jgi:hypothetical protein
MLLLLRLDGSNRQDTAAELVLHSINDTTTLGTHHSGI